MINEGRYLKKLRLIYGDDAVDNTYNRLYCMMDDLSKDFDAVYDTKYLETIKKILDVRVGLSVSVGDLKQHFACPSNMLGAHVGPIEDNKKMAGILLLMICTSHIMTVEEVSERIDIDCGILKKCWDIGLNHLTMLITSDWNKSLVHVYTNTVSNTDITMTPYLPALIKMLGMKNLKTGISDIWKKLDNSGKYRLNKYVQLIFVIMNFIEENNIDRGIPNDDELFEYREHKPIYAGIYDPYRTVRVDPAYLSEYFSNGCISKVLELPYMRGLSHITNIINRRGHKMSLLHYLQIILGVFILYVGSFRVYTKLETSLVSEQDIHRALVVTNSILPHLL